MTLGEKLLYLRKIKGLSQEQLARQVHVSRQAVSKWELGESLPGTDKVVELTKILGVTADYLLNDEVEALTELTDVADEEAFIQSMLEEELTDDSDLLALPAKRKRGRKPSLSSWLPILFSGLAVIIVIVVYLLFFR